MPTQGQQDALNYQNLISNRSLADYMGGTPQDLELEMMQQSSEGSYDPQRMAQLLAEREQAQKTQGADTLAQQAWDREKQQASANVDWWNSNPNGHDSFLDKFMPIAMTMIVGGLVGGSAAGLFEAGGAGGATAAGSTAAGAGLGDLSFAGLGGALPINTAALGAGGAGFSGLGAGTAAGLGAGAAGAGGLGSMIGVAGGAPAVVTVGAPAAAAGGGLGGTAAAAGGLGLGISNMDLSGIDQAAGGVDPGMKPNSDLNNVNPVADGAANLPIGSGGTDWLKLAQQGGNLFDSLGGLIAGNHDRITNLQDQQYYEGLMNKMMGMYQPGTPEATLMEQQMNAKDAAAGRNSQYGVRATNLAGQLAGQRAQIMTSPTFNSLAQASRGHYDNSLNSLFSAAGNANNGSGIGSTIGQIGNGISSILGLGKSLFG